MSPLTMTVYSEACAWTLARAHARTGDRIAIAGYLGAAARFDAAIATFAEAYADQNERDHQALRTAVQGGRIAALVGL
jgi:thiamine monophosphate kinase